MENLLYNLHVYIRTYICIDTNQTETRFNIRLVGGNNRTEGRVEIFYNNTWGTVCDDSWSIQDAMVVCRQLGYDGAVEALSNAYFGPGDTNSPIYLDDVVCFGNEERLSQCLFPAIGQHNCRHYEDAGVRCYCELSMHEVISILILWYY